MSNTWPIAISNGWHPVAYKNELHDEEPLGVTLMDIPIVLFRSQDGVAALIDRCPHRNVPLSGGKVCDHAIVCPYHGWAFNGEGQCIKVPGIQAKPDISAKRTHVTIRHSLIWICLADDPPDFPVLPKELDMSELDGFWWPLKPREARAIDALENHLDPMHPHFLHPHLVRGLGARLSVPVSIQTTPHGGQARYAEEHLPQTLLPKIIEGKRICSIGKYFTPLTGQVAFENSKGLTIAITVVFAPLGENRTRPFAHFATRKGRMPTWLKNRLITAFHQPILVQDAAMLKKQARNITQFGGAKFASGPADILNSIIWQRVNGEIPETYKKHLELEI